MQNSDRYFPIVVCPELIMNLSSIFYFPEKEIDINAPGLLIKDILRVCDGEKSMREALETLGEKWQSDLVEKFIESLIETGIVCDSRFIGDYVWKFVKNPTRFIRDLSDEEILRLVINAHKRNISGASGTVLEVRSSYLRDLIEKRCSIRSFLKKEVSCDIIAQMLWTGYGVVQSPLLIDDDSPQQIKVWQKNQSEDLLCRHTVPSAGALYPLRISLVLFYSSGSYNPGIYDICFRKSGQVEFVLINSDVSELLRSFADPTVCNNAQGAVVVSGSFAISGEKYGNRSLLYVALEAGHAAQNIHLSAIENNIGTVEIGGFLELQMRHAIELSDDFWPLTTIIFGYPLETESICDDVSNNLEMRWFSSSIGGYQLPFSMVFTRLKFQKSDKDWTCGRAKNPFIALSKASSEAYEWNACGNIPNDLLAASFKEINNPIDPRKIIEYHHCQYKRKKFPLKKFDENQTYFWKNGQDIVAEEKSYILSDCIYFPYDPETPRYTYANSSGTAAHPIRSEAIKKATLELIERDAFMIVWLNCLKMPQIYYESLPVEFQKRISLLQKEGFKVIVKNFTMDLSPVIFVFAQNDSLPITTCSGCSEFDAVEALDHALMEVEAAIYCRLGNQPAKFILPQKACYPEDHGNVYEQRRYYHRADFLFKGKGMKFADIGKNTIKTWDMLLRRFEMKDQPLIVVDLDCREKSLNVVKAFLPGVIPMSFGYGLEPCGMERIYNLPVNLGYRINPISYKEITRFLHPYT